MVSNTLILAAESAPPLGFIGWIIVGGLAGSLLAGIGWSICIIAERLAKRGLL